MGRSTLHVIQLTEGGTDCIVTAITIQEVGLVFLEITITVFLAGLLLAGRRLVGVPGKLKGMFPCEGKQWL